MVGEFHTVMMCGISFWDDWMRQPSQRLERACIRPEIPRTSTFGKIGVSKFVIFCQFVWSCCCC